MGFRTETRNFVQTFILDQSDRRMYELGLAADVLKEAVSCASIAHSIWCYQLPCIGNTS